MRQFSLQSKITKLCNTNNNNKKESLLTLFMWHRKKNTHQKNNEKYLSLNDSETQSRLVNLLHKNQGYEENDHVHRNFQIITGCLLKGPCRLDLFSGGGCCSCCCRCCCGGRLALVVPNFSVYFNIIANHLIATNVIKTVTD